MTFSKLLAGLAIYLLATPALAQHDLFSDSPQLAVTAPARIHVERPAPRQVEQQIEQRVEQRVAPQAAPVQAIRQAVEATVTYSYPTNRVTWNISGNMNASRSTTISHLLSHPNHRGKFSRSYLEGLSNAELRSLHDDDHENRVQWQYVRAGNLAAKRSVSGEITMTTAPSKAYNSACPGGVCPSNNSRGARSVFPLFRRRF